NRTGGRAVEDGRPDLPVVRASPHSPVHRRHVEHVGGAGHTGDRHGPAAAKWPDASPFHFREAVGFPALSQCWVRCENQEYQCARSVADDAFQGESGWGHGSVPLFHAGADCEQKRRVADRKMVSRSGRIAVGLFAVFAGLLIAWWLGRSRTSPPSALQSRPADRSAQRVVVRDVPEWRQEDTSPIQLNRGASTSDSSTLAGSLKGHVLSSATGRGVPS